jgi:hypothetical protein
MVYQKDEKVLCFHHELLYEAKVLDSKPSDPNDKKSPLHYRVHYKGWKNTYVISFNWLVRFYCWRKGHSPSSHSC